MKGNNEINNNKSYNEPVQSHEKQDSANSPETKQKQNGKRLSAKKKRIIFAVGTTFLAGILIAAILLLLKNDIFGPVDPDTTMPGGNKIGWENVEQLGKEAAEAVEEGMFMTHMNMIWTFPDGKSPSSDAIMGNSLSNKYAFYFTLRLKSSREVLFTSKLIPVGTKISEITLGKQLKKGTYDAAVTVHMVDAEGEPLNNNMGFNIKIVVKK